MSICKYCNQPINWAQEGGRNRPKNPDGTDHACKPTSTATPATSKPIGDLSTLHVKLDALMVKLTMIEARIAAIEQQSTAPYPT